MTKLHQQLTQLEGNYPNIIELGARYETSPRALNQQFKLHFNESIFSFIQNLRMNKAYHRISTTKQGLKSIAADFSYSHVNHFSTAFKNHFGYSPNQLRKSDHK
jgi:AraC-like DNA-binding protein